VNHNDREIVLAIRTALAERVGQDRFDVWFGAGVRLQTEGRQVRVLVGEQFLLDRIRSQFRGDLESVCKHVIGAAVALEFQLDPAVATPPRRRSPSTTPPSPAASRRAADAAASSGEHRDRSPQAGRRPWATLDEFVIGPSNCVAFTAAQRVLQNLGQVSPLLIHGPTGTGKTHLLEGVAHAARGMRGVKRVVLMSSEQFTSYFLEALHGGGLPSFRRKHRDVDVLLIDDVQFFSDKRATIVELKHTVDTLLRERRQLVFAADRPVGEISGLGPELVARISGGLVCSVESPEEETRLQVVRQLAQRRRFAVPDEVLQLIASRVPGDVRQLGGALNRLQAMGEALRQPLTPELAESALADVFRSTTRIVRLPDIETAVCDVFGIDVRSLQSHRKSKTLAQPRMLAMWLARKFTRAAFSEIGEYFGRRSHSTVISAQKKVECWLVGGDKVQLGTGDCDVRDALRRVEARLRTG